MLANPFVPSASTTLFTVTSLASFTSLLLNVAVPVAVTVSPLTRPFVIVSVGAAVVVPSYTLFGAATLAVRLFAEMNAATVWPLERL